MVENTLKIKIKSIGAGEMAQPLYEPIVFVEDQACLTPRTNIIVPNSL